MGLLPGPTPRRKRRVAMKRPCLQTSLRRISSQLDCRPRAERSQSQRRRLAPGSVPPLRRRPASLLMQVRMGLERAGARLHIVLAVAGTQVAARTRPHTGEVGPRMLAYLFFTSVCAIATDRPQPATILFCICTFFIGSRN